MAEIMCPSGGRSEPWSARTQSQKISLWHRINRISWSQGPLIGLFFATDAKYY